MKASHARTLKLRSVASALSFALLFALGLQAQTPPKKPAPAPSKPAPAPKPASAPSPTHTTTPTASHASGTTTGSGGATTTSHGSGVTTGNTGVTTANRGAGTTTGTAGATTTNRGASTTTTATPARGGFGGSAANPPANGARGAAPAPRAGGGGTPGHPAPAPGPSARDMGRAGPMAGHHDPAGTREISSAHGVVRTGPDGHIRDAHLARGVDVHHGIYGGRRVGMERPGGGRAYFERGRPGYLGHPFRAHGYEFNRRTYYDHGRAYERFYRPYGYHGYALDVYVPGRYYAPGFYGWAYQPWGPRVTYSWGFAGAPWYGAYGGYFQPYPVYATPALWLTDYTISQSLAAGYAAQQESGAPPAAYSGPALSADVKQQIAQEVQADISLENYEAQGNTKQQAPDPETSGIGHLLTDGHAHVFIADKEVDVTAANQQECALTDGDVIQVTPPGPADADTTANATVLSSKGGRDCPIQSQVAVGLDDLSEMNNHLREMVDRGLEELQSKQGTGGLPKAPGSATAPGAPSIVAENDPPPEPAGAKDELERDAAESLKEEGELAREAQVSSAPGADAAPTETLSLEVGQSLEQVQSALGAPTKKVVMGSRTIYYFGDTKVTMSAGKVTKIE